MVFWVFIIAFLSLASLVGYHEYAGRQRSPKEMTLYEAIINKEGKKISSSRRKADERSRTRRLHRTTTRRKILEPQPEETSAEPESTEESTPVEIEVLQQEHKEESKEEQKTETARYRGDSGIAPNSPSNDTDRVERIHYHTILEALEQPEIMEPKESAHSLFSDWDSQSAYATYGSISEATHKINQLQTAFNTMDQIRQSLQQRRSKNGRRESRPRQENESEAERQSGKGNPDLLKEIDRIFQNLYNDIERVKPETKRQPSIDSPKGSSPKTTFPQDGFASYDLWKKFFDTE